MLQLTKYSPDIIDFQIDPRLQGEVFGFVLHEASDWYDSWVIRLGPFKLFWDYSNK